MKKEIRLNNVIFPIWLLWLIPATWFVVIPANYIIDLLVLYITIKCLKLENPKEIAKKTIWKVYIFGFISDFIGTAVMFLSNLIAPSHQTKFGEWWYNNILSPVSYNPFESIWGVLWCLFCILISAICIYYFNLKISFKNLDIPLSQKKKLALSMAIFTAPYLFIIPTAWAYNG